jgi:hypothetical protein
MPFFDSRPLNTPEVITTLHARYIAFRQLSHTN